MTELLTNYLAIAVVGLTLFAVALYLLAKRPPRKRIRVRGGVGCWCVAFGVPDCYCVGFDGPHPDEETE